MAWVTLRVRRRKKEMTESEKGVFLIMVTGSLLVE